MKITETALKFNTTVYVLILCIIVAGGVAYKTLPLEAQPDVEIPIMLVSTVYPGVSPEDMERLVTNVMERELADLKDVKQMTSSSSESASTITIEFETGVDLDVAYQKVKDKVDKAKPDLPDDAEDPTVIEISFSDFPMMLINVSGEMGLDKLKIEAEKIKDSIEQVEGVLGVDLTGGLDREIHVYMDPAKMEYYALGVNQIISRIQQEHLTTPAGNLELGGAKYSVRIPGEYKNVQLMENIVLKAPGGNPVRLKDVARVHDGYAEQETLSRINGKDCITLGVKKRVGENIVRIAGEIKKLLEEVEPKLAEGVSVSIRQDQSKFIKDLVTDLENNIISGLILVLAVLLFSMGIRNAFFVAIAIPLSMLISFIVLMAMGITLNFVVLFSLILALGMLVDNSIVIVENIYRHVAEGATRKQAALRATQEVAWPVITSTLTTLLVFAPLLFWPGIMGEFMSYLPITTITVLTASLFVALVINPVVAANFLKPGKQKVFDDSGEAKGSILHAYQKVLRWSLDRPTLVLFLAIGAFVGVVMLYIKYNAGIEFMPNTTPERGQATITAPQGTVLGQTDNWAKAVETIAKNEDNMKDVIANVGTGGDWFSGGGGGSPTHKALLNLEFKDRHDRTHSTWDTVANIREKIGKLPGAEYRVDVEEMGPPTGEPVSIEIYGDDFDELNRQAAKAKELIASIKGVVDIKDDYVAGKPEIRIDIDRDRAMLRKVNTQGISMAVRAAVNGMEASVLREGDDEYEIIVRFEEKYRTSIEDILNIRVTGEDDVQIPLRDVAKVYTTGGLGSINHIDQKRTIKVTSDVADKSAAEVMVDVKKLLAEKLKLPAGYALRFSGEDKEQQEAQDFLVKAFGIGFMLMLVVLITQFNSVLRPTIILSSVVMSMMGVLAGLLITGDKISVLMTGLGVISLAGVVVNNAIVLIDYTDQLTKNLGLSLKEALIRAGVTRFRPVLLTAITTVLGLIPMAIGVNIDFTRFEIDMGSQSLEWWGPMARAVSFGLAFATVLTLVIVPVMYLTQEKMTGNTARALRFISGGRLFSTKENHEGAK